MPDKNGTNGLLTPTQKRLLDALADGCPHACVSLFSLLDDPAGAKLEVRNGKLQVQDLINKLRHHLDDVNDDRIIICEFFHRRSHYRMVRPLVPGLRHGSSIPGPK